MNKIKLAQFAARTIVYVVTARFVDGQLIAHTNMSDIPVKVVSLVAGEAAAQIAEPYTNDLVIKAFARLEENKKSN